MPHTTESVSTLLNQPGTSCNDEIDFKEQLEIKKKERQKTPKRKQKPHEF